MNRQQAKELLPIIQAFAVGKTIQYNCENENPQWIDVQPNEKVDFSQRPSRYRIKPESKYRPFKHAEECWQEMRKHEPFGWVKKTCVHCNFLHIMELYPTGIVINDVDNFGGFKNLLKTYNFAFAETTFADGTPFGIKEEE